MRFRAIRAACAVLLLAILGACAGRQPADNQQLIDAMASAGLEVEQTERGVTVYLPHLFFEYGSAELNPLATEKIIFIADFSREELHSERRIAVEGHTDSHGSEEYNMELSSKRANAVTALMEAHGASSYAIETAWFGESRPKVPNELSDGSDNPEGRAVNRRVEVIFLD